MRHKFFQVNITDDDNSGKQSLTQQPGHPCLLKFRLIDFLSSVTMVKGYEVDKVTKLFCWSITVMMKHAIE